MIIERNMFNRILARNNPFHGSRFDYDAKGVGSWSKNADRISHRDWGTFIAMTILISGGFVTLYLMFPIPHK